MKKILIFLTLIPLLASGQNPTVEVSRLEVSDKKTVHVVFPKNVVYVDLGSNNILAGRVDWAENVIRVKSAISEFADETTFSVMTSDSRLYTFIVNYCKDPSNLNVVIADKTDGDITETEVRINRSGRHSTAELSKAIEDIYTDNRTAYRSIGVRDQGMDFLLKGLYTFKDVIIVHLTVTNNANISYDIDYIRFILTDRKAAKRTPVQEITLDVIASCGDTERIEPGQSCNYVLVLEKTTFPKTRQIRVELAEKNGGRHLYFNIRSNDLLKAKQKEL